MAIAKYSSNQAASSREFKHRVLTCLNKLSDRDTYSAAANELDSIAKTLSHDSIPPFISSISATDSSDKSPVRKQCVRLISLVSETHGNALSPYLSKLLSSVVRRLRDHDSAVRSSCINAMASISSHITKPPFTAIVKPLIDALVTEQDQNSQIGAALCLSSAIDASPDPEPSYLRRLMPKLEKLLKCESFKAKPALLTLIGSIIGAGLASSQQSVKNLVECLVEFVSSEDWAARKASAEALAKLAVVEREMLSVFKTPCLKTFEAKRFDKVKVVRETMNQMVEAWKEIPDIVVDQFPQTPEQQTSSKEAAIDGLKPSGFKTSSTISSGAPQIKKKHFLTPAQNRGPVDSSNTKKHAAMFRKLDKKKPGVPKLNTTVQEPSVPLLAGDDPKDRGNKGEERSVFTLKETKRTPFNRNPDEKMHKFSGTKAGSHVVPCIDDMLEFTAVARYVSKDVYGKHKECEDISLIRKQLLKIENQQSGLLDLLQGFIGSSQNGMRSLESRVHGLELALDEISFDLAVSTGRMSNSDSTGTICCRLPGAGLLSSKRWRKTEGQYSTSRFSPSAATPPLVAMRHKASKIGENQTLEMENMRFRLQGGRAFVVNPLAEVHNQKIRKSNVSSSAHFFSQRVKMLYT